MIIFCSWFRFFLTFFNEFGVLKNVDVFYFVWILRWFWTYDWSIVSDLSGFFVWLIFVLIMLFKTGLSQCLLISLRNIGQVVFVSWTGGGFVLGGSYFGIGLDNSLFRFFFFFLFLNHYFIFSVFPLKLSVTFYRVEDFSGKKVELLTRFEIGKFLCSLHLLWRKFYINFVFLWGNYLLLSTSLDIGSFYYI